MFTKYTHYTEFDEKLAGKLAEVRTVRLPAALCDFSYDRAIN